MYPILLQPIDTETFNIADKVVKIPKCVVTFDKWLGEPIKETFGGKPIVAVDNKPMFAELAIMTLFIKSGWNARWVETYGKGNQEPICLTEWKDDKYKNQIHKPIDNEAVNETLHRISKINSNTYAGCWDVVGWQSETILFAESKRNKKDSIRESQINWLSSGLKHGLSTNNFLMVQWDMRAPDSN